LQAGNRLESATLQAAAPSSRGDFAGRCDLAVWRLLTATAVLLVLVRPRVGMGLKWRVPGPGVRELEHSPLMARCCGPDSPGASRGASSPARMRTRGAPRLWPLASAMRARCSAGRRVGHRR